MYYKTNKEHRPRVFSEDHQVPDSDLMNRPEGSTLPRRKQAEFSIGRWVVGEFQRPSLVHQPDSKKK
jgi:hypothetical protein